MKTIAFTLAALALIAASPAAEAATVGFPTGQHARAMSNVYRAQQRNNAAIRRVQSNIAATRHTPY